MVLMSSIPFMVFHNLKLALLVLPPNFLRWPS